VLVGSSGPWITGIVGEILSEISGELRSTNVDAALARAVRYLAATRLADGGWGYNEALPADCDSTAYALILQASARARIARSAVDCLRRFQREDGAFLTYLGAPPGHSWGAVHWDVHGAALRAVIRVCGRDDPSAQHGLRYTLTSIDARPLWPAFWWKPQIYAAVQNLLCLYDAGLIDVLSSAARTAVQDAYADDTPASAALSGLAAVLIGDGDAASHFRRTLLNRQLADGSWPSSSTLRVTEASCFDPWNQNDDAIAGPVYRDTAGVFSTAIAVKFLMRLSSSQ
jgi:hypothetical protein